jgi:hypothetical protein
VCLIGFDCGTATNSSGVQCRRSVCRCIVQDGALDPYHYDSYRSGHCPAAGPQPFQERVVCLHGLPMQTDCVKDPQFAGLFWRELVRLMGTKRSLSTAFYPQTDGQTERTNRVLEEFSTGQLGQSVARCGVRQ